MLFENDQTAADNSTPDDDSDDDDDGMVVEDTDSEADHDLVATDNIREPMMDDGETENKALGDDGENENETTVDVAERDTDVQQVDRPAKKDTGRNVFDFLLNTK